MPRKAREKSESGIYHVMLRGINKQHIFLDDEDFEKFLWVLHDVKEVSEYKLLAYCLMGNHIHLLLKVEKEPIEQIFRRVGTKFVYWYNIKYQRVGHLFQGRFKSEPIDEEGYLFSVIRYIHQNPVKANICDSVSDYRYSSYREYVERNWIVDKDFILQMMPIQEFIRFNNSVSDDKWLDFDDEVVKRLTDKQAIDIIELYSGCRTPDEFICLSDKKQAEYLGKLKEEGVSIRQASRLTGVNISVVRKYF